MCVDERLNYARNLTLEDCRSSEGRKENEGRDGQLELRLSLVGRPLRVKTDIHPLRWIHRTSKESKRSEWEWLNLRRSDGVGGGKGATQAESQEFIFQFELRRPAKATRLDICLKRGQGYADLKMCRV